MLSGLNIDGFMISAMAGVPSVPAQDCVRIEQMHVSKQIQCGHKQITDTSDIDAFNKVGPGAISVRNTVQCYLGDDFVTVKRLLAWTKSNKAKYTSSSLCWGTESDLNVVVALDDSRNSVVELIPNSCRDLYGRIKETKVKVVMRRGEFVIMTPRVYQAAKMTVINQQRSVFGCFSFRRSHYLAQQTPTQLQK